MRASEQMHMETWETGGLETGTTFWLISSEFLEDPLHSKAHRIGTVESTTRLEGYEVIQCFQGKS